MGRGREEREYERKEAINVTDLSSPNLRSRHEKRGEREGMLFLGNKYEGGGIRSDFILQPAFHFADSKSCASQMERNIFLVLFPIMSFGGIRHVLLYSTVSGGLG